MCKLVDHRFSDDSPTTWQALSFIELLFKFVWTRWNFTFQPQTFLPHWYDKLSVEALLVVSLTFKRYTKTYCHFEGGTTKRKKKKKIKIGPSKGKE